MTTAPIYNFARDRAETSWRHGYHLLPAVINRMGLKVGCEIGVANAGHADAILTQCPGVTKLYGVDPYEHRADYDDLMNLPQPHLDAMYVEAREFMARHGDRFDLLRGASLQAVQLAMNDYFDFVYIDAEHTYEACRADMEAWYPKLRPGGVLSGHDYGGFPGVTRAVDEFCAKRGLALHVESEFFWWTVKNG